MTKNMFRRGKAFHLFCFTTFVSIFGIYFLIIPLSGFYIAQTTNEKDYKFFTGKVIAVKDSSPHLQVKTANEVIWVELPVSEFLQSKRTYIVKPELIKELIGEEITVSGYYIPRVVLFSFRAMTIDGKNVNTTNAQSLAYLSKDNNLAFYFWIVLVIGFIAAVIHLFKFSFKEKS
jgi:hypothetical protein